MAAPLLPPFRALPLSAVALALSACGESVQTPIEPEPMQTVAPLPGVGPAEQEAQIASAATPDDCNARLAQPFVEQQAAPGTRTALLEAVSPNTNVRWVGPGEPTTEELTPRRLNVMLDAGDVITSVHCG